MACTHRIERQHFPQATRLGPAQPTDPRDGRGHANLPTAPATAPKPPIGSTTRPQHPESRSPWAQPTYRPASSRTSVSCPFPSATSSHHHQTTNTPRPPPPPPHHYFPPHHPRPPPPPAPRQRQRPARHTPHARSPSTPDQQTASPSAPAPSAPSHRRRRGRQQRGRSAAARRGTAPAAVTPRRGTGRSGRAQSPAGRRRKRASSGSAPGPGRAGTAGRTRPAGGSYCGGGCCCCRLLAGRAGGRVCPPTARARRPMGRGEGVGFGRRPSNCVFFFW